MGIDNSAETEKDFFDRIGQYHFMQDFIERTGGYRSALLERVELGMLNIQTFLHVNRLSKYKKIYKGSNWFSITHPFAVYLLSKKTDIQRNFGFGLCADELFLQTIIMNSPFRDNMVNDCLRYTDWERGSPYTFSIEDYDILLSSGKLFARKFDYSFEPEIVDRIFDNLHYINSVEDKHFDTKLFERELLNESKWEE